MRTGVSNTRRDNGARCRSPWCGDRVDPGALVAVDRRPVCPAGLPVPCRRQHHQLEGQLHDGPRPRRLHGLDRRRNLAVRERTHRTHCGARSVGPERQRQRPLHDRHGCAGPAIARQAASRRRSERGPRLPRRSASRRCEGRRRTPVFAPGAAHAGENAAPVEARSRPPWAPPDIPPGGKARTDHQIRRKSAGGHRGRSSLPHDSRRWAGRVEHLVRSHVAPTPIPSGVGAYRPVGPHLPCRMLPARALGPQPHSLNPQMWHFTQPSS